MRAFALPAGTLALALMWAGAGCGDPLTPGAALVQPGLVLSEAIETPSAQIVYVSLRAGTVPEGVSATATNVATGASVQGPMVDGGLDPLALPAAQGDSIEVDTRDGKGRSRQFGGTVHMRYPPVVVRTGPGRGTTDVGLNPIIIVVFSEPIDQRTVSPETIELTLDGQRVPAEVTPSSDGLRAELDPGGLLPAREYTLVVRTGIRDRDGLRLEEEYRSTFSTLNAPAVASVTVSAESLSVAVGQPLVVSATLIDSLGNPILGIQRRVRWSAVGDALVVDMGNNTAAVRARRPGVITVTASFEARESTLDFNATAVSFASVSAGYGHTCALNEARHGYCWGINTNGEVGGIEYALKTSTPTAVNALDAGDQFSAIAAGDQYTCALDLNGSARCWGASHMYRPESGHRFNEVSTGFNQACGLQADGRVRCWGLFLVYEWWFYLYGDLPFIEERIEGLTSGRTHSCGVASGGSVLCWGRNDHGQLGDGTRRHTEIIDSPEFYTPETARVISSIPFRLVSAGARHTCALDASGRAYCWGEVNGTKVLLPQSPAGGRVAFSSLTAGDGFTCGLTPAGQAYCWGRNTYGQLGNGTTEDTLAPMPVSSPQTFTAISAGRDHACGIMADGLLYCWGRGADGELGNGLMADQSTPTLVAYQR